MSDRAKPVRSESGCRVGWDFYADLRDAEAAAERAQAEAWRMRQDGYDFGLSLPGELVAMSDGTFRVTVP